MSSYNNQEESHQGLEEEKDFPPQPKLQRQNGYSEAYTPKGLYYPPQQQGLYYPPNHQFQYNEAYTPNGLYPQYAQYVPIPVPVKERIAIAQKDRRKSVSKPKKSYYDSSEADTEEQTEPDTDFEIERLQKKIEKKVKVVEKLNNLQSQQPQMSMRNESFKPRHSVF
jgi:hypothetical protein